MCALLTIFLVSCASFKSAEIVSQQIVDLRGFARVKGSVSVTDTVAPAQDALVQFICLSDTLQKTIKTGTDVVGDFDSGLLRPGTYQVSAVLIGYSASVQEVLVLGPNTFVRIHFMLRPAPINGIFDDFGLDGK